MSAAPRIYNLFPSLAGPIEDWPHLLPGIAAMGFDTIYVNPFHQAGFSGSLYAVQDYYRIDPRLIRDGAPDDMAPLRRFLDAARGHSLAVIMDLVVNHTARDCALVEHHPDWYRRDEAGEVASPFAVDPVDPGKRTIWGDLAELDWAGPAQAAMTDYFSDLACFYTRLGFDGFRCDAAYKVPATVWAALIGAARAVNPACRFFAETLGCQPGEVAALAPAGFDYLFNSVKWWDGAAPWFWEQYEAYRVIAPSIGFPESHDTPRLAEDLAALGVTDPAARVAAYRQRYLMAACLSAGIMMPMGFETGATRALHVVETTPADVEPPAFDLGGFIAAANRMKADIPALNADGPMTALSPPGAALVILARWTPALDDLVYILINRDPLHAHAADIETLLSVVGDDGVRLCDVTPETGLGAALPPRLTLAPFEVRVLRAPFVATLDEAMPAAGDQHPPRIVIEDVWPLLDDGRFPVKRILGDTLEVWADIYRDGHDKIAAALGLWQRGDARPTLVPMRYFDNDRWVARIPLTRIGLARFTIIAWTDHFASWRDEAMKKRAAGQDIALELTEGDIQVTAALRRAEGEARDRLAALHRAYRAEDNEAARADVLLSRQMRHAMALVPERSDAVRHAPDAPVMVDRPAAGFAAWYEMFPRSQGQTPGRSATFADCAARLPEIRALGFDVVYLVPIHPIGAVNRKGRGNSLTAGPDDPGSPYAIGSRHGGHDAIDPNLGTLDDFREFQRAVRDHGMELAMDFAVQCAPDHPWLTQHPNWFRRRADGGIRYAENPPKKYEDIVNVDFDQPDWNALWRALLDITLFWAGEGVRIFRVDNPHTKPVAFWHWLIGEVLRVYPDALFLSEAFTRPKMMRHLAKIGFTQSYSYFTWRNTKAELTEYLTELTQGPGREYFRPNFFTSTPDILPTYLQTGGRAAFRIRLALAATLSPVYGIYNGFELCEATALPGREEYADSEKYTYKVWDWDRPGHIKDDIAKLNAWRRARPALRRFTNLEFCPASHDDALFYAKYGDTPDETVLVLVALDPHRVIETEITLPMTRLGLAADDSLVTEELFTGERRAWTGAIHRVVIDPSVNPAMVLRVISLAA